MKSTRSIRALILVSVTIVTLFVVLATMPGCASPIDRAYTTRTLFNAGLQDVITAKQTGAITDAQLRDAVKVADQIAPEIDKLEDAAIAGESYNFESLYSRVKAKVREFLINAAKSKKKG